jgi:hypothetical protein
MMWRVNSCVNCGGDILKVPSMNIASAAAIISRLLSFSTKVGNMGFGNLVLIR